MGLFDRLKARAVASRQRIVLAEGYEPRTLTAADRIIADGIADVTLIGDPATIHDLADEMHLPNIANANIVDPSSEEVIDRYAPLLYELRKKKGMTPEQSRLTAANALYLGCLMIKAGDADGMVAGQVLDTLYGIQTEEQLKAMYRLKTGVMISGAAELGCVAADMPADMRAQAVEFADRLGLAFQIRDDMLDVVGDEQVFGKPIGSDMEEGKITYVDVDGLEGCARAVEACTRRAKDAVAQWPDHDFLFALADQLVDRNK